MWNGNLNKRISVFGGSGPDRRIGFHSSKTAVHFDWRQLISNWEFQKKEIGSQIGFSLFRFAYHKLSHFVLCLSIRRAHVCLPDRITIRQQIIIPPTTPTPTARLPHSPCFFFLFPSVALDLISWWTQLPAALSSRSLSTLRPFPPVPEFDAIQEQQQ